MISTLTQNQFVRRLLLATLLLLALICAGLALNAVSAKRASDAFDLAGALPRGAAVYAQFKDLPGLLKDWNESKLKERYLQSANFNNFQSRHLALKLVARWQEFNDATGFPVDAGALAGLADNRAAIAVYEIGKLELVMIAPLTADKLAASAFLQNKGNFEEVELPDGSAYYLHDVEADRGRQRQQIGFAAINGQFILATSEKLLVRTIANLTNGKNKKDRLSDDPAFRALSQAMTPHLLTVWVDQTKLNDDWYFRHYWLQQNLGDLKKIRAGIFDLEMRSGDWVERREFLLNGKPQVAAGPASAQSLQSIARIIPGDTPFVQARPVAANGAQAAAMIRDALFGAKEEKAASSSRQHHGYYDESSFEVSSQNNDLQDEGRGESRYSYLDYDYDQQVDEGEDEDGAATAAAMRTAGERRGLALLQSALQPASAQVAVKLAKPRAIDSPLFAEFNRAVVISLRNAAGLNRPALEHAIAELAANHLMISGASQAGASFDWKTLSGPEAGWREMKLPALGRSVFYAVRAEHLILSNSDEMLAALTSGKPGKPELTVAAPLNELTIIRLSERQTAFDQIFAKLDEQRIKAYWRERKGDQATGTEASHQFFSGEIPSLLDTVSPVGEVRIERSYKDWRMREQVSARFK